MVQNLTVTHVKAECEHGTKSNCNSCKGVNVNMVQNLTVTHVKVECEHGTQSNCNSCKG